MIEDIEDKIDSIMEDAALHRDNRSALSVTIKDRAAWRLRRLGLSYPQIARVMAGYNWKDSSACISHGTAHRRVKRYREGWER